MRFRWGVVGVCGIALGGCPSPGSGTASAPASASASASSSASGPVAACKADSECVLTTFPGCCSCCPCAPLRAIRKEEEEHLRNVCAVVECAACKDAKVKCPACTDPAKEGMRARCINGTCTLVETKAP